MNFYEIKTKSLVDDLKAKFLVQAENMDAAKDLLKSYNQDIELLSITKKKFENIYNEELKKANLYIVKIESYEKTDNEKEKTTNHQVLVKASTIFDVMSHIFLLDILPKTLDSIVTGVTMYNCDEYFNNHERH